jgi:hypothetical protein
MNIDPTLRWQILRQHSLPRNFNQSQTAGFSDSPLTNLWEEFRRRSPTEAEENYYRQLANSQETTVST